jgi:hypothetical protein
MAWRWRDLSVGLYAPLLEFNQKGLGPEHADVATSLENYASCYEIWPLALFGAQTQVLREFPGALCDQK